MINKSKKLEKGDSIAFLAPASGLAQKVPHRVKKAKEFFEDKGYKVKIFPSAEKNEGFSSDTPQNRAKDINEAFADDEVKAIISTIGGKTSHQILEYLDFETIKNNPKIFCGYSDMSSLHFAFNTHGNLVTFYGPAAVPEFGETLNLEEYTEEYFFKAITNNEPIGQITPSKHWTDHRVNWLEKEDLKKERKYKENPGFEWLKKGKTKGKIIGGCVTSLEHTKGTKYWPDFKGKILLLETPEGNKFDEGEPLINVDSILSDFRIMGLFDQIKGIVFGRGFGYTQEEHEKLKEIILFNTRDYEFPIVYGVDIGHSDPMITIPLDVEVTLDSENNIFSIDENGVN